MTTVTKTIGGALIATSVTVSTTPLTVARGGTSSSTLTSNNVILGNGTSAPQFVAPSTSGNVLTSNGTTWVSQAPSGGSDPFTIMNNTSGSYTSTSAGTLGTFNPSGLSASSVIWVFAELTATGANPGTIELRIGINAVVSINTSGISFPIGIQMRATISASSISTGNYWSAATAGAGLLTNPLVTFTTANGGGQNTFNPVNTWTNGLWAMSLYSSTGVTSGCTLTYAWKVMRS